jgi:hypothetical protein
MIRLCLCYDCLRLWMLVFDYMIRLYNQDISVRASPAVEWRGSAEDSARVGSVGGDSVGAGSAGGDSAGARTGWITVRNCLSSTKDKVANIVTDKQNECWWGQWWRLTLEHESEYEIVQGLWSSCPANYVANPGKAWGPCEWCKAFYYGRLPAAKLGFEVVGGGRLPPAIEKIGGRFNQRWVAVPRCSEAAGRGAASAMGGGRRAGPEGVAYRVGGGGRGGVTGKWGVAGRRRTTSAADSTLRGKWAEDSEMCVF